MAFDHANRIYKMREALSRDPHRRWCNIRPLIDNDLANTVDLFACAAAVFGMSKEDQLEISERDLLSSAGPKWEVFP